MNFPSKTRCFRDPAVAFATDGAFYYDCSIFSMAGSLKCPESIIDVKLFFVPRRVFCGGSREL